MAVRQSRTSTDPHRRRVGPDGAERISAGCYGALIAATTLIGTHDASLGGLILVVVITNLIYYATHVFAYTVGAPTDSEHGGRAAISHHLKVSAPMISVTFAPVIVVVVFEMFGVSRDDALVAGVVTALFYLVSVATTGAYLRGLRPMAVALVGVLTFLVSAALVAAKLSLH